MSRYDFSDAHDRYPIAYYMSNIRSYLVSTWQDMRALPLKLIRNREALAVIALTLLPWCILIIRRPDLNNLQQLGAVIVFVAFYWLIYHRQPLKSEAVRKPALELTISLVLAALWILYRIGEYWHWYKTPILEVNACSGAGDVVILKMVEMVLVPFLLLLILRYSLPQMGIWWSKSAWLTALPPLAVLIAFGLTHHPAGQLAISSACYLLDAGLPEEFLFRVFLLTRLEAVLHRPLWALFAASFIFGLAHVPIDLQGSFTHWPDALLTAFTFQMSAGMAFGYAYMRTKNLLPVSIIHAVLDSAL